MKLTYVDGPRPWRAATDGGTYYAFGATPVDAVAGLAETLEAELRDMADKTDAALARIKVRE